MTPAALLRPPSRPASKPLVVPSRLLAAVHRLDDLLGAPSRRDRLDLVDWLQHEQASMRWLATCLLHLGGDTASAGTRSDLVRMLCLDIAVTTRAEAELLMPALRDAGAPAVVLDDVGASHDCLRTMVRRVRCMTPDATRFGARAVTLARLAHWHATFAEEALCPIARRLVEAETLTLLGARYAGLREELQLTLDDDRLPTTGFAAAWPALDRRH